MREGWGTVKLADVCSFGRGLTFKKSDQVDYSSTTVLRANNISLNSGDLVLEDLRYIRDDFIVPQAKKIRKNSLLVCTASGSKSHLGKIAFIDFEGDYAFGGFMGMLTPNESIDPKFLYWLTEQKNYTDFILDLSDGVNINNLKWSQLCEFSIPLPPLAEQKRIVAVLDEAFAGIKAAAEAARKNLASARELFETTLNATFTQKGEGWVETTLGEVCELISGQHIDAKDYNIDGQGIGYLTGPSDFGRTQPIITKWTEHPKRTAKPNDILITVKGSGVGKINMMTSKEVAISRQLMAIRATDVSTKYMYLFVSQQFAYFQSLANGAAIPGISRTDVLNLKLAIPNDLEQARVIDVMSRLEAQTQALEALYQRKLDALEELKQSLLQKAFAGELTHTQEAAA